MKKYLGFVLVCLICFSCERMEMNGEIEFGKYRESLANLNDSTRFAAVDSAKRNPILASLQENYKWDEEKKMVVRSPFSPGKVEVKIQPIVRPVPKPVNEAKGLNLAGIIQVGTTTKALVNGNLYEQGDWINNLNIISIGSDRIILKSKLRIYTLYLNEN